LNQLEAVRFTTDVRQKEKMAEHIARHEFLTLGVAKCRKPVRIAFRLLIPVVIAWLALLTFQVLRAITIDGWVLIGCIALLAVALSAARWAALTVYARLSPRNKAVCRASAEAFRTLTLVAVGILAWHKIRTGHMVLGTVVGAFVVLEAIRTGYRQYKQGTGEPALPSYGSQARRT
jgi:hypothetical protein